jgi:hypothetical protein
MVAQLLLLTRWISEIWLTLLDLYLCVIWISEIWWTDHRNYESRSCYSIGRKSSIKSKHNTCYQSFSSTKCYGPMIITSAFLINNGPMIITTRFIWVNIFSDGIYICFLSSRCLVIEEAMALNYCSMYAVALSFLCTLWKLINHGA